MGSGTVSGDENRPFIHLKVHSAFSLLEGALPIPRLAELCQKHQMPALALTDTNNLFGALEFSETMVSAGIQPICGISLSIAFPEEESEAVHHNGERDVAGAITLFAKDEKGFSNLLKLATAAHFSSDDIHLPHVTFDTLKETGEGLIALTGGPDGPIDRALRERQETIARTRLDALSGLYEDRLYCEVQRHQLESERNTENALLKLAYDGSLPLVATNEVCFATAADYEAHDALIAIAEGVQVNDERRRRLSPNHHFATMGEMNKTFADLPEAIENTFEIAHRCAFRPVTRAPMLPKFAVAGDNAHPSLSEADELRRQAEEGLVVRLERHGCAPGHSEEDYKKRLSFELDVIIEMDFPGYFLIVADFIQWAKGQNIPVGPGRGSGAGSVVAWALTITDLDPLQFGLLFERFLNPERVSMPDFDIDFCQERRDEVITYVKEKYGEQQVAQIITFGKLQARAVLRDVGRVLGLPYGQVDRLCKLIPNNPADPVGLAEAIAGEARLREARDSDEGVARLLEIALKLEGLYRHASTHAAGIVIAGEPLQNLVPVYRDPRSEMPATQYNMKWAEKAGLVKFDFLGLKTLSVIDMAQKLVASGGTALDIAALPLDDRETFEMVAAGETVGIFQLESSGMREALRNLKPDRFEDIIAMVALYRPGPMANIESFVNRKNGEEEIDYLHPWLEPVLTETYGIIIYQEQVMEIAKVLSGYSLGEADLLRRAMGKKDRAEMNRQKTRFVDGAIERGVVKAKAEYIFDLVARFAGYGFNKSHAAAYALVAYQTAYLKTHHPCEFFAASMTYDMGNTDKLFVFKQEIERIGITLQAPSINASHAIFSVEDGAIRYALAALKNVGRHAAEHIAQLREQDGVFADIGDFARRVSPRHINKRALESIVKAGAFDDLNDNRAQLLDGVQSFLGLAHRSEEDRNLGQVDMFSENGRDVTALALPETDPWPPFERLAREFEAVGFFLSGHPLDEQADQLAKRGIISWATYADQVRAGQAAGQMAGVVTYRQDRRTKKGDRFAFVGMSDPTGQYEAAVFSEVYGTSRDMLEPGNTVVLTVRSELEGSDIRVGVQSVRLLEEVIDANIRGVTIFVRDNAALKSIEKRLETGGQVPVTLALWSEETNREVLMKLPGTYAAGHKVCSALKAVAGVSDVREM